MWGILVVPVTTLNLRSPNTQIHSIAIFENLDEQKGGVRCSVFSVSFVNQHQLQWVITNDDENSCKWPEKKLGGEMIISFTCCRFWLISQPNDVAPQNTCQIYAHTHADTLVLFFTDTHARGRAQLAGALMPESQMQEQNVLLLGLYFCCCCVGVLLFGAYVTYEYMN